jgi:hypothetical protein
MRIIVIIMLLSLASKASCQFIPDKNSKLSNGMYNKYRLNLDTAYMNNDLFEVGIQLANLLASSDTVFNYLDAGIIQNAKNCDRIFNFYNVLQEGGFKVNIVKIDTPKFLNSFSLCEELIGENAYNDFLEKKQKEYQERMSKRVKLDSTKFDYELIKQLDEILNDDQRLRMKMQDGIKSEEYEALWQEQKKLDSLNLIKVQDIIEKYGYPGNEAVGYDHAFTPLLVLHHQADLETRMKYMPILQQALKDKKISEGAFYMFKWRNENIKLSKE